MITVFYNEHGEPVGFEKEQSAADALEWQMLDELELEEEYDDE